MILALETEAHMSRAEIAAAAHVSRNTVWRFANAEARAIVARPRSTCETIGKWQSQRP
jgi:transcriptional regulator with XRE-family HTH domain